MFNFLMLIHSSMTFNHNRLRWWCIDIRVNGSIGKSTVDVAYNCSSIDGHSLNVPIDKSYACQENLTFPKVDNTSFTLQGLQV